MQGKQQGNVASCQHKYIQPWFDLQLDAQNSCLFTYNTFIKLLYMFRALPCSSSGGLRRNCIYMQPLVSIPDAAYIQLRRRPPDDEQVMLETCKGV